MDGTAQQMVARGYGTLGPRYPEWSRASPVRLGRIRERALDDAVRSAGSDLASADVVNEGRGHLARLLLTATAPER